MWKDLDILILQKAPSINPMASISTVHASYKTFLLITITKLIITTSKESKEHASTHTKEMCKQNFKKGDNVEIIKIGQINGNEPHTKSFSYFSGNVLRSPRRGQDRVYVEYTTLMTKTSKRLLKPIREYIEIDRLRPSPPQEGSREMESGYVLCENVDAFHENGWRKGIVVGILRYSKYLVSFEGFEKDHVEVDGTCLRVHREWINGLWNPPPSFDHENNSSQSEAKPKALTLKIKFSKKPPEPKFKEGALVEVKSYEEGFQGSWFIAVIVKELEYDKFLVEYRTLRTEDMTDLLKEEADVSRIRQCPPVVQRVKPFETQDRVDVWYNDGWWEGYIVRVLNYSKYIVHFPNGNDELEFEHCKLRLHQEWIDGKWFEVPKISLTDMNLRSNNVNFKRKHSEGPSEPTFRDGMMVEVKSDEEGYQGSWYTAAIVCSLPFDQYLVEYQALKTDDESELLKEKALASYIRPCPPEIVRVDRFKMLEEVEAWYNDGWWVGLVSKVLDGLKYGVYFWTTNEELEFQHCSLRPHQEWVDGRWIEKKESKLVAEKTKRPRGRPRGRKPGPKYNSRNGQ